MDGFYTKCQSCVHYKECEHEQELEEKVKQYNELQTGFFWIDIHRGKTKSDNIYYFEFGNKPNSCVDFNEKENWWIENICKNQSGGLE